MRQPLFSVIIPTYNRATLVGEAIDSVYAQSEADWELIVVDDGSTDDTVDRLKKYAGDTRFQLVCTVNGGKSAARNRGIEAATGLYYCFLDSDDWWLPHHLTVLREAHTRAPNAVRVLRTGMRTVRGKQTVATTEAYRPESGETAFAFFATHMVGIHTLAYHRDTLATLRYDLRFRYFQDTQLLLRVLRRFPLEQLPAVTAVCRAHEGRSSYQVFRPDEVMSNLANNLAAIRSVFPGAPLRTKEEERLLNYMLCKKNYDYATGILAIGRVKQALAVMWQSWKHNNGTWLWWRYVKFVVTVGTKWLFDYPKLEFRSALTSKSRYL